MVDLFSYEILLKGNMWWWQAGQMEKPVNVVKHGPVGCPEKVSRLGSYDRGINQGHMVYAES